MNLNLSLSELSVKLGQDQHHNEVEENRIQNCFFKIMGSTEIDHAANLLKF
jgi:hypothetical protein